MAKKEVSPVELVETHKPKNVKFKYIFTDDSLLQACGSSIVCTVQRL